MTQDLNKIAQQMLQQQWHEAAEKQARDEAASLARQRALQVEVHTLATSIAAALKTRGDTSFQPLSVDVKYNSFTGRTKRQVLAAWKITEVTYDWKDTTVTTPIWLLTDGEFAIQTLQCSTRKACMNDGYLARFIPAVRDGLRSMAKNLGLAI